MKHTASLFVALQIAVILAVATSLASAGEQPLYTFQSGDDCAPYGSLIADSSGNLYGTTYGDRSHFGRVYQLTPAANGTWTETVLHTFTGSPDGHNPVVGVVRDQAGNLYGTTPIGGANSAGIVYELSPGASGWTENVIYSFTGGNDGADPYSSLILDQTGNLYGTTSQGGTTNNGVIFKLTPGNSGWTQTVLYSFTGGNDGGWPMAPLIMDQSGNLYGTTSQGGTAGMGVAFKLSAASGSWSETVLYSFTGENDGGDPEAGLVRDQTGAFYGTTSAGGSDQSGMVFQVRANPTALPTSSGAWTENALYSFTGGDDGSNPNTGLVFDQAGRLNGTVQTGAAGWGAVFQMTPGSGGWTPSTLYSFTGGTDGGYPESTVYLDNAGNVYGTTVAGGQGCGVVYEITP